jgi:phosphatidylinositol alpha-mannosyltransferase
VSDVASEYVRGLTSRDITIIPNGIDLDLYKTRGGDVVSKKTGKQILFIGRLEVRKGLKYLLKAFSLVKQIHPDLRLEVVGDGPDRQKLEKLVQEEELRGVRFLGLVSELTKIRLLHESDLFCSPAIFGESFGIVLLEAMACNLVTVAGDNSGYASVMKDTGKISLVNPKDINDFARRLELMIYFPEIRTLWQSWAQEYIQQFNYDDVARQYEALYKVAVREKNRVSKHRI